MFDWESATWKGRAVAIILQTFALNKHNRLFKNLRLTCIQFFASEPYLG